MASSGMLRGLVLTRRRKEELYSWTRYRAIIMKTSMLASLILGLRTPVVGFSSQTSFVIGKRNQVYFFAREVRAPERLFCQA